jgi:hypothetical protein
VRVRFADVAIEVEHQRDSLGIDLLRLEDRHVMIHLIVNLRLGLQTLRRDAPCRRNDELDAVDVVTREFLEGNADAVNCHRRFSDRSITPR